MSMSIDVMGILNMTPDSFSDGGSYSDLDAALYHVERMVQEKAAWVDIGGESTRPDADTVTVQEEYDRVIPLVEAVLARFDVKVSVDTSKPAIMAAVLDAGAHMINDIRALTEPEALDAVARHRQEHTQVCLMHMQGQPQTMQIQPNYKDVIQEVYDFFVQRIEACMQAGIPKDNIWIDPGFGFGKTTQHNYMLLQQLPRFQELTSNILVGLSRKTMLGTVTGKSVDQRLYASVAGATLSAYLGAKIIRVHDVEATYDAVQIAQATKEPSLYV